MSTIRVKTCKWCGNDFGARPRQTTCSEECKYELYLAQKRKYERKKSGRNITPETGQAQLISAEWPRGYGIYHWGEIRETAEYGSWPADAVFVDINDASIRFKIQSNSQTTYDPEIGSPQTLVKVE